MSGFNSSFNSTHQNIKRAKPLIYVAMLIMAWVMARIIYTLLTLQASDADIKLLTPQLVSAPQAETIIGQSKDSRSIFDALILEPKQQNILSQYGFAAKSIARSTKVSPALSYSASASNGLPNSYYPLLFLNMVEERSAALIRPNSYAHNGWDLPSGNGNNLTFPGQGNANNASKNSNLASRLSGYAFIFGRSGDGDANALGGRYGGSQAAVQLAYRINPAQQIVVDATLRAQSALRGNDREIAAGLRVKPNEKFPVALIAERRFRPSNPDGYAIYVAGGISDVKLPANFKLNSYGQAGLSTAGRDTLFFDGQVTAEKSLHKSNKVEILAGGGAWAGGQRGAQRLDIGPSVSVRLSSGERNYRISGDWRERIGGNAAPNSGAAITLSTDF